MEEGSSSPTLEECSSSPATEESSSSPATESSSSPAAEVHANIRLTNFKPWAASPGRVVRRSREQPPNDKTKKKIKDALYISEILNSTEWVSGPPSPVCKINGKHLRSNDRRSVRYRKGFTRPPPVKTNGRLAGASRRVVATSEKSDSSSGAESYATALSSFDSPRPMETKSDTSSGEGVDAGGVELSQKYPPNIIRRVPCSAGQPVTCKTTGTGINSAGRPVISKSAGTGTCSAGQPVICSIPRLETCSAHRPVTCKSSRLVDCKTGRPVICKTAGTITFSACQPVTCTAARSVTDCTAALPRGSRITLNIAKSSTDQSATAAELHPQPSTSSSSSETEMEFFDSQPFAKTSLASCSNKPAATASTKRAAASTKRLVDIIPIRRSRRETDDDEGAINVVGKNMLLPLNSSAANATELTTERDSKKKTNTSKKKKSVVYNYLKLKEIKKAENVNKRVCCHAVVSNFAPPFKSRGSDWVVNMNIIDESIHPDSLKCRLFIHDEDSLPRIEAVGDTVRLHRLKIVEYLDEIQGQSCPGFSCLVFHDDPALDPSSTSNNFTWSSADETRVVELKNWMKTVKLVSKPSLNTSLTAAQTSNTAQKQNRKTISQVQHGNHVNLLCQVIGCLHLNPVKSVLRIWDGTRLPQAASCQRYRDIQCDDDLVIISQDLSVDVLIFDEHCKDLAKIKANDYVEVVDLRVDRGRLVQTDFAFILNGGESNKRGIYKLDENSAEFSQLEQQLNTAIDEFYP
ncbi:uncharacterized protein LOC141902003 [Tubulanus polymorphus]|uniref:uncharacterized protein LOC141902003 n=1 Tax=Tubulanus polymorphus TaxID=672921 RepID=UPI003DA4D499